MTSDAGGVSAAIQMESDSINIGRSITRWRITCEKLRFNDEELATFLIFFYESHASEDHSNHAAEVNLRLRNQITDDIKYDNSLNLDKDNTDKCVMKKSYDENIVTNQISTQMNDEIVDSSSRLYDWDIVAPNVVLLTDSAVPITNEATKKRKLEQIICESMPSPQVKRSRRNKKGKSKQVVKLEVSASNIKSDDDLIVNDIDNSIKYDNESDNDDDDDIDGGTTTEDELKQEKNRKQTKDVGRYSCPHCPRRFKQSGNLSSHMKLHAPAKRFKCSDCNYSCNVKKSMRFHSSKHTGDKPHRCKLCEFCTARKDTLKTHMKIHTDDGKPCVYCSVKFKTDVSLKKHMKVIHEFFECDDVKSEGGSRGTANVDGVKQEESCDEQNEDETMIDFPDFGCIYCDFVTPRERSLLVHVKRHKEGNVYKCFRCQYHNKTYGIVKNHIYQEVCISDNSTQYTCTVCSDAIGGSDALGEHSKTHPELIFNCDYCEFTCKKIGYYMSTHVQTHKPKKFMCDKCGQLFATRAENKQHKKKHSTYVRPKHFLCNHCAFTTVSKSALNNHMQIKHGKTKSFQCTKCEYSAHTNMQMICHMVRHGEKKFLCDQCDKKFYTKNSLNLHLATHSDVRVHSCKHCPKTFKQAANLTSHMKIHAATKMYRCSECPYECNSKKSLRYHGSKHTGYKPFSCELCEFSSGRKDTLKSHMKIHTDDGIPCSFCSVKFKTDTAMKKHLKVHNAVLYHCTVCDYSTNSAQLFSYHNAKHTGLKSFQCEFCDYSTERNAYLTKHLRTHIGAKNFICHDCGKGFLSVAYLNQHRAMHSDVEYPCPHCNYIAKRRGLLKSHVKRHTDNNTVYKCDLCEYSCKTKPQLRAHSTNHTGIKPHMCSLCNFACVRKFMLMAHMKAHFGGRTIDCHECNISFPSKLSLQQHKAKVHPSPD